MDCAVRTLGRITVTVSMPFGAMRPIFPIEAAECNCVEGGKFLLQMHTANQQSPGVSFCRVEPVTALCEVIVPGVRIEHVNRLWLLHSTVAIHISGQQLHRQPPFTFHCIQRRYLWNEEWSSSIALSCHIMGEQVLKIIRRYHISDPHVEGLIHLRGQC